MMQYSVQPRDKLFENVMGFCLLLKIWVERLLKI